jgi:hypothetical protein
MQIDAVALDVSHGARLVAHERERRARDSELAGNSQNCRE